MSEKTNTEKKHRIRVLAVILLVFLVMFASSCASEKEASTDIVMSTDTEDVTTAVEIQEQTGTEEEKEDSFSTKSVFDLIDQDGRAILDVALAEDGKAAVLYYNENAKADNELFSVEMYALETGIKQEVGSAFGASQSLNNIKTGKMPQCRFISLNPLLISDEESKIIYSIEQNRISIIPIQESEKLKKVFYLNTSILALTNDCRIVSVSDKGVEDKWVKPSGWADVDYVSTDGVDSITLKVNGGQLHAEGDVYFRLNVQTWAENGFVVPYRTALAGCFDEGKEIYVDSRYNQYIRIVSSDSKVQQKINDAKEYVPVNYKLGCSVEPVDNDLLIYYIRDPDGIISNVLLVNTTLYPEEQYDAPKEEPCVILDYSFEGADRLVEEIENKYGVKAVFRDFSGTILGYSVSVDDNPYHIIGMLKLLSETLELYPEGFFFDLKRGWIDDLTVYISLDIEGDSDAYIKHPLGVAGRINDGKSAIVLLKTIWMKNGYEGAEERYKSTVVHELSHIIDMRLERDDPRFWPEWNKLNPKGFSYSQKYYSEDRGILEDDNEYTSFKDINTAYFIDSYAKTEGMEDRARIWDHLMKTEVELEYYKAPGIKRKAEFYFQEVRKYLASETWPEETFWEKRLREAE